MIKDPVARKKTIRPLLLEPCGDLPLFLKTIQYIDVSTPKKCAENYPKICSDLGGIVEEDGVGQINAGKKEFEEDAKILAERLNGLPLGDGIARVEDVLGPDALLGQVSRFHLLTTYKY